MTWLARAACRDADPELFSPLPGDEITITQALASCERCRVRIECLWQGIGYKDWETVRGGLTGPERAAHHRSGLRPEGYPPHILPTRKCVRCSGPFTFEPRFPRARVCPSCLTERRRTGDRSGNPVRPCVVCRKVKTVRARGGCCRCYESARRWRIRHPEDALAAGVAA